MIENEKFHTIFVNEDGKNKVLLFDHKTNQRIDFPEIKDGDVLGVDIAESEKNLLLTVGSSTSPQNLYVYNMDKKNLKHLTSTFCQSKATKLWQVLRKMEFRWNMLYSPTKGMAL